MAMRTAILLWETLFLWFYKNNLVSMNNADPSHMVNNQMLIMRTSWVWAWPRRIGWPCPYYKKHMWQNTHLRQLEETHMAEYPRTKQLEQSNLGYRKRYCQAQMRSSDGRFMRETTPTPIECWEILGNFVSTELNQPWLAARWAWQKCWR